MNPQKLSIAVVLVVAILGANACRKQVTVSQPPAASSPVAGQYHQDAGVTLAIPQTNTAVNIAIHAGTWK